MLLFWPFKLAAKILSLIVSALVIYLLYCGAVVVAASDSSGTPTTAAAPVGAIVVLVPQQQAVSPSADLVGRLNEAIVLYHAGVSTRLFLIPTATSAPVQLATAPLAANEGMTAARSWLLQHGISGASIDSAGGSTTYAGLLSVADQLNTNSRVAIVTDAVSAYWVSHAAAAAGLVPHVYPAAGSKRAVFNEIGSLWRQATGVAVGRFFGYSRTTWVNS